MPRPGKPVATPLQLAVSIFMDLPVDEAIAALEVVNAIVLHRVDAEHYVPTTAAQDTSARPKAPQKRRGRPPAAQGAMGSGAATGDAQVPSSTAPPAGDVPVDATPPVMADATGDPGSLTMPTLGAAPPPDPPVAPAGGRAQTT